MEENTEKKKHGKRRHYRGKNNDKSGGQGKQTGQEQSADEGVKTREKKENRPKPHEKKDGSDKKQDRKPKGGKPHNRNDRPGKKEKQEKGHKQEDRKQASAESAQEASGADDKQVRIKREQVEPVFEFTWADAWGLYRTGYHIVVKESQEKMYLSWSVDLSYGEMKLGQRLQEFLDDMKAIGLSSWDGRRYTKPGIFDGDTWSVKANSLTLKCESQGTNEYPEEWKAFLECLHKKWSIPVSKREQWE
ncbi:MAG: hypothetical protein K6G42_03620 [Lachnospiraceae bacterium]|nr:hypothetical protein [Lachnospiraceae bacterium]